MPPAARITDMHTCPVPTHVGGPVVVGELTVLIGYMPATREGDKLALRARRRAHRATRVWVEPQPTDAGQAAPGADGITGRQEDR